MSLSDIIERVEGRTKTLSVLNPDISQPARERLREFFEPQQVRLRAERTESGQPSNVALLHDGSEFVAASPLEAVDRYIRLERSSRLDHATYPDVLEHVEDTTFTSFGKRRMIVASREIESFADDMGAGELHGGFQQLSRLRDQWDVYRELVTTGLDVHIYGVDDLDSTPGAPLAFHAGDPEGELAGVWFVVYDGDGDDEHKRAMLAEAVGNDKYTGFWTTDPAIVDDILTHLRETYHRWEDGT